MNCLTFTTLQVKIVAVEFSPLYALGTFCRLERVAINKYLSTVISSWKSPTTALEQG